jgi:hypothetical protein
VQFDAEFASGVNCREVPSSSRLVETLPAINQLQTVGSLEWQHPTWILKWKSADLIQLPKLVMGERELHRREIVLKLVEAFRGNDDRQGRLGTFLPR